MANAKGRVGFSPPKHGSLSRSRIHATKEIWSRRELRKLRVPLKRFSQTSRVGFSPPEHGSLSRSSMHATRENWSRRGLRRLCVPRSMTITEAGSARNFQLHIMLRQQCEKGFRRLGFGEQHVDLFQRAKASHGAAAELA